MRFFRLSLALLFCTLLSPQLAYPGDGLRESRVIFDEDFSWITKEGADKLLARISEAGFNVLVPNVWHGRGTSWPSQLAPKEPKWAKQWRPDHPDPFAYLIERAHRLGIEVHPWFTVALRRRDFLNDYYDSGTPAKAFDLHRPEFRAYIVDLILEVVGKYDVDGVNLDYIRTKGLCKSQQCIREYKEKYDRNLIQDIFVFRNTGILSRSIVEWTRDATTDVVRQVSKKARQIRPDIVISVDSVAGIWKEQGAASVLWANEGLVDLVFHMDYGKMLNAELIGIARTRLRKREALAVLVGNFDRAKIKGGRPTIRDARTVVSLLDHARRITPESGVAALYWYTFLTDEQIELLKNGPFAKPAAPHWKRRSRLGDKELK